MIRNNRIGSTDNDPVAAALEHLHDHEPPIMHRDVKPANVIVTSRGHAVLVDFGIAGTADGPHGTQGFLAPEVAAGARPAARRGQTHPAAQGA